MEKNTETLDNKLNNYAFLKKMTPESYESLPNFVQVLIQKYEDFEILFLMRNPKFISKAHIDYLPDFDDNGKKGRSFCWRYVGWDNGKKYTGSKLRKIRRNTDTK